MEQPTLYAYISRVLCELLGKNPSLTQSESDRTLSRFPSLVTLHSGPKSGHSNELHKLRPMTPFLSPLCSFVSDIMNSVIYKRNIQFPRHSGVFKIFLSLLCQNEYKTARERKQFLHGAIAIKKRLGTGALCCCWLGRLRIKWTELIPGKIYMFRIYAFTSISLWFFRT